jgi:hypothetical protein
VLVLFHLSLPLASVLDIGLTRKMISGLGVCVCRPRGWDS